MPDEKRVAHFRKIVLWPVHLLPLDEDAPIQDHWEQLAKPAADNPWVEVDDEFGDPTEFQERHYNEFVTFLPPVQRFLYGQGLGRSVRSSYGESPIKVMRRSDVARVRVRWSKDGPPQEFDIAHVDLYFFFDIDIVILAVELFADDMPLDEVHEALFRTGRAYPSFWDADGRGGNCPWKVEWLSRTGEVMAASDYEKRDQYLSFVCRHRAPRVASHWEFLLNPMVPHHADRKGLLRYRQLEYFRMPYMAFLGMEDPDSLSRQDEMRLAEGWGPPHSTDPTIEKSILDEFEARSIYVRSCDTPLAIAPHGTRFLATGDTLLVIGSAHNDFCMSSTEGLLSRFRHQHFLLFLLAHFQKAALGMFADRLVATVSKLDVLDVEANRTFRHSIRLTLENFLRFAHRYWFHEISKETQARDIFAMTRTQLKLDALYSEVREELQDMANFLEVEATRKQNETVVRLTVVTILGLIGTITTGFIGMNVIDWADEPAWWRVSAFFVIFIPAMILTIYTVMKSRGLSEFLDTLADEKAGLGTRMGALMRVWRKKKKVQRLTGTDEGPRLPLRGP